MNNCRIKATFLDEISHDIPHQNWGAVEWERDFCHMRQVGIDTVVLIRNGYRQWLTYPSSFLMSEWGCLEPSMDLVQLFLDLSEKYGMTLWMGLYDSGVFWWDNKDYATETEINLHVIQELWSRYGGHNAFGGWYMSHELSRKSRPSIDMYVALAGRCKAVSMGLPVLMSPYIDGSKAVLSSDSAMEKTEGVSVAQHAAEWNDILAAMKDVVDIVAFQDGQVPVDELTDFLKVNKKLCEGYGLECWTNVESFDRDMPIKFLPIKWDKLWHKLRIASEVGIVDAITFEFSHFMSPQSAYLQAGHLYNRYKEYLSK